MEDSAVSGHSTETNDKWGVGVRVGCLQSVVSPLCQFNGGCNSGGGQKSEDIFLYISRGGKGLLKGVPLHNILLH